MHDNCTWRKAQFMLTKTQQFPLHNHCHTLLGRRAQNKSHSMYFFQFNQSVKCLSLKKKIKLYTKTSTIDAYLNIPMIPYWAIGPKFMTVKSHYNVQHKWCKSNLRNNEVNLPPVLKSYMVSIRQEALTGINKFLTIWYHTSSYDISFNDT